MQILTGCAESGMRHRRFIALVIAVAASFAWAGGAANAANIEVPPRRAPGDLQVQQGPANCSRWTDQCVNCSRGAEGASPVCSNIGFACQPQSVRCLSPAIPPGEPAKK